MFNLFKKKNSIQTDFNVWVSGMGNRPSEELVALNFGLFESTTGFRVYLFGSNEYKEDNDDWACNEDFIPQEKYLNSNLESETWHEALSELEDLINGFIESAYYAKSIVKNVDTVTCGFDGGELKRIKTHANKR